MRNLFLLTFFFILILSACSKQGSSTTKLKIVSGNEKAGDAFATGGVMLYGESKSLGMNFAIPVGSELTKDLPNGDWSFYAVMWDGATPLTGTVKCATPSSYTLKGQTVEVLLTLSLANCENGMFAKNTAFSNYTPNYLYNLTLVLCPPSTTQSTLSSSNYCTGYSGMATGLKARVLQKDVNSPLGATEIVSTCIPFVSGGYANTGLQLLSGNIPDYLGAMSFEVYYSSAYPSCSGDNCCTGRMDNYIFPNGFGNQTSKADEASLISNSGNSFYLKEHSAAQKVAFTGTNINGMAEYKACNVGTLELRDSSSNVMTASEPVTVTPTCAGKCTMYADSGCTTAATSYTIASGTSSHDFYFMPAGPVLDFSHAGSANVAGDSKSVTVHVNWGSIDSNFLWAESSLYNISNGISVNPAASLFSGAIWIYETRNGNRGAMKINSVSTSTVANDTFNFDFITWSSGGGVVATNTNVSITACFTGTCYLELDENFGVTNDTTTYQVEAWWESNSGLYFNPQSVPFFQMIP